MALIIEDGTMPEGANSYVSVAGCDSWQALRGSTTWPPAPASEDDPNQAKKEGSLIQACDYLNGLAWKGSRPVAGRVMAWPRVGVVDSDGFGIAPNVVPINVPHAQCYLAGLVYDGTDLQPMLARGGAIRMEQVDVLRTEYFEGAPVRDIHTMLMSLLGGLAMGLDGLIAKNSTTVSKVSLA